MKNRIKHKPKNNIRGLNPTPYSIDIIKQIATALGMKIHEDSHGISAYGGNRLRLANHCTYLETWVDNGTWNAPYKYDIVIEDTPTQAMTDTKKGYDFSVLEFIHDVKTITPEKARIIAYDIRNTILNGSEYANNVKGEKRILVSTHNENNNQNKIQENMKITENELRQIIRESLNELDWKTYMNAAEKAYKQGPMYNVYGDSNETSNKRQERSRKFLQAAEDALNRDFGYEKNYKSGNKGSLSFATPNVYSTSMFDDVMGNPYIKNKANLVAAKEYNDGGRLSSVGSRDDMSYNDYGYVTYPDNNSSWGYHCGERKPKSDIYKGDSQFKNAIDKAEKELKNYEKGKYEYVKGKGWQLKDDVLNEAIKRAIRKYLN